MVEPTIPWGALPYARLHFVVMGRASSFTDRLVARTRKKTKGMLHKEVTEVWWEGGSIAETLNTDENLKSLLMTVLLEEDEIYVDPTENCVRIYGKWKPEHRIEINKRVLEAYNAIAAHVKNCISELAVP